MILIWNKIIYTFMNKKYTNSTDACWIYIPV